MSGLAGQTGLAGLGSAGATNHKIMAEVTRVLWAFLVFFRNKTWAACPNTSWFLILRCECASEIAFRIESPRWYQFNLIALCSGSLICFCSHCVCTIRLLSLCLYFGSVGMIGYHLDFILAPLCADMQSKVIQSSINVITRSRTSNRNCTEFYSTRLRNNIDAKCKCKRSLRSTEVCSQRNQGDVEAQSK